MRTPMLVLALVVVTGAGVPAPAPAQEPPPDSTDIPDLLRTILLPAVTERLRERGVPTGEIETVLMGARERGVPPAETARILDETVLVVEEHGPIDNFGAFVQERLRQGLRGRELAAAIRAEHQRRGIGQGKRLDAGAGRPGQGGQPAARGGRGRPDTVRPDTSAAPVPPRSGAGQGGVS